MKRLITVFGCFFLSGLSFGVYAQKSSLMGELKPGQYTTGFRLVEKLDKSRYYPAPEDKTMNTRLVRIYTWYPALKSGRPALRFEKYVRMAAADFGLIAETVHAKWNPTPLAKGLDHERLNALLNNQTSAVPDVDPAEGVFPLVVFGQGLYYEFPLSHLILCEYLASHGYVVATCPLIGNHCRLVNLNAEDLETEVRDLEFVIAYMRTQPYVHPERLGIIGYDLGGMAGLVLSMRNPDVDAFLSLDAGILFGHFSGLPNSHPNYHEDRFTIPWMHITQSRFIKEFRDEQKIPSLIDRKKYSDSYLVPVPTTNHGAFSSYAMFGIHNAVPGYWGPIKNELQPIDEAICRTALIFFNAYLKKDSSELLKLHNIAHNEHKNNEILEIEYSEGQQPPPSKSDLIHLIIQRGIVKAKPFIEDVRTAYPDSMLFDENVLNWLGYHFLYWWGREEEAIEVFELNVSLFPESANTYDSLGEAYMILGDQEKAIKNYRRSLKLNPENQNARRMLEQVQKQD